MKITRLIMVLMIVLTVTEGQAEDSAPFLFDSVTTSFSPAIDSLSLSWDASWIGDYTNATVVIADNGTEVKCTTGIGEFEYVLPNGGRHKLTYTTYINGVALDKIYSTIVYAPYGVVAFDANGGRVDEQRRNVDSGSTIGELPLPMRTGYSFNGWWTSAGGGTQITAMTTVKDNVVCYAHWIVDQYIVTFAANGGSVAGLTSKRVTFDSTYGDLPIPTRIGYTFAGWTLDGEPISSNVVVSTAEDHTLVAQWAINQYTVTFDATGGTGGYEIVQDYGTEIVLPIVTREGCTFEGWTPEVDVTVPASNVTYMARWKVWSATINLTVQSIRTLYPNDYANITNIELSVGVTDIPSSFFLGCSSLESVMLPDGVISIADCAFYGCSALKNVMIPDSAMWIGEYAFYDCSGLTSITIPESVTSIGNYAFHGCSGLTTVTISQAVCDRKISDVFPLTVSNVHISDSVTDIADYAFAGCTNLQTEVWGGYRVLDGWLIGYTDEAGETIPDADKLKGICSEALKGCTALKRLEFGDNSRLVSIGAEALKGCTELNTLVLPSSLTRIGDEAFMGCSYLDNVIVPGSVKSIGNRAFKNCTGFTAAQIEHGVESIGDGAFYADWQIAEVDIPSTVTNIGVNAFGGDSSIIRVGLRGDVRPVSQIFSNYKYIREATVKEGDKAIVDGLFRDCSQLSAVHFLGNCPLFVGSGENLYRDTRNTLTTYARSGSTGWDGTPGSHALPQAWPLYGSYRRSIAWWDEPTYLVLFDSNGGTLGVQDTYQRSEQPFLLPPEPVQTGYGFAGWWTKPSGGLRVTSDTVFIEGVYTYIYAHWMKAYRVFLNPDGGTVTNDYVTYLDQTVYGVLPAAVRTGYAFGGWRYNGRTILPNSQIVMSDDHTLTAQWEAYQYSIRFDPNGGAGEMDPQPITYDEDTSLSPNQFSLQGYMFQGWAMTSDGPVEYNELASVKNLTSEENGVVTLYAVWQEKPASVLACEDAFGGAGTVTLNENDNIVVTLTNDVSGTVEIPDYVGVVMIDLNGHDMVGDGGLGETALPGGPAIRIVKGDGESGGGVAATRLAIVDTSEGEKGQVAGGGESAGIEVAEDAAPSVRFDVEEGVCVFNGDGSEQPWWELCPVEATLVAGKYFKATLVELGYDVPTNGTPYSVVAKGLPAGLKLKYNAAVTKKVKKGKTTKTVVVKPAKVEWWIEGVPTAAVDFFTNPPYLVITANGVTTTEPLPVEVLAQNVTELEDLALGQTLNEQYYLPGVTNGWTVSGLPTGLKYTAKLLTTSKKVGKKTVVTTNALPYSVYGKTTKAGLFTITAKRKVGAFYETKKYRVLVTPKAPDTALFGEDLTNIVTMAYVPVAWDLAGGSEWNGGHAGRVTLPAVAAVGGKVAKVSGLPPGLTFAASDMYAYTNAKKKTGKYLKQTGQTIVGTPTKPGMYVVTFTKNVKNGKTTVAKTAQILWKVKPNDVEVKLGFNEAGGVIESGVVGLNYGDLLVFSATSNATVTASGLPAGIKLVKVEDGRYAFTGYTTKAGMYLVTVKATLKGKTVTQRLALKVEGLPAWAKGTFNGCVRGSGTLAASGEEGSGESVASPRGLATATVSAAGKISGKFQEFGTNWTFSAVSYTDATSATASAGGVFGGFVCSNVVAQYAYKVTETVKGKKKTVTKYVKRTFHITVAPVPVVQNGAVRGVVRMVESGGCGATALPPGEVGAEIEAWQNLWGRNDYKALGKALFSTKSGKKTLTYKMFTIKSGTPEGEAIGLGPGMSLAIKVTTTGAVTATMTFDTGKTKKDPKTKKTVKVYYKPMCQSVVIPRSAADAEDFTGDVLIYFAPSRTSNFPGFSKLVEL